MVYWVAGLLSAVNSDAAIAVELPQTVMVSANAAAIKVLTFFLFMIFFPLYPIFHNIAF